MLLSIVAALSALQPAPPDTVEQTFPPARSTLPSNGRIVALGNTSYDVAFIVEDAQGTRSTPTLLAQSYARDLDELERDAFVLRPGAAVGAITLQPSCGGCDDTFAFTVDGDADVVAPRFLDGGYSVRTGDNDDDAPATWTLTFSLPALADDEPTMLMWRGLGIRPNSEAPFITLQTREPTIAVYGELGDTICFDVTAVDVAGNESAPLQVCADIVEPEGCAQSSSSSSSSFGVLGLALLFVRRRR